ncbi:hypothetical protein OPT61_g2042 [Boeremia exigua]|uniref:Uncharacterized protein n=1 Tax=Boeremia exigua TaxID=749465 RepID=A0ACC2IMX5_9PLEO|nr:hypothetical protein OPT61_g2042 [Boeremia exigua]
MILFPDLDVTTGTNKNEIENKDPLIVTPPRKHSSDQHTASTTPATPRSKSTPLHKRFLEQVTMSPGTSSKPPRTPTKSPSRGARGAQTPKQTLEVGKNGFYFSMEIPEKKITPRRAATPETKVSGRLTPSPEKQKRSEVKAGGRVRDILRKNLFGTPTKQPVGSEKEERGVRKVPSTDENNKARPSRSAGARPWASGVGESERAQDDARKEAAADHTTAPFATRTSSQSQADSTSPMAMAKTQQAALPSDPAKTPDVRPSAPTPITKAAHLLDLQKEPVTSTPSNMGHLIANHSSKSSKVQVLPTNDGSESMPTPLRKMSEKLGLRSPHVLRKDQNAQDRESIVAVTEPEEMLRSPISALDLRAAATVVDGRTSHTAAGKEESAYTSTTAQRGYTTRDENRLRQLLPSPITTIFPVVSTRPSTATSSLSSPSTPSRPGLQNRAKSFGTPSRLRSSMQEDMFKVQESLKRSLGQDVFQAPVTRPTTPSSPLVTPADSSPCKSIRPRLSPSKSARPVSMAESPKSTQRNITQAVPRRLLDTAARKPRPKSMIVGSAKILETVASQIDSPRERAKLRSAAATPAVRQTRPAASRPGTPGLTSQGVKPAVTRPPVLKPQTTARTAVSAAPRTTAPNRAARPTSTVPSSPLKQRTASAEVIASQISDWNKADRAPIAPQAPVRRKTTKAPSAPISHRSRSRAAKTPEPKDSKADSGTAQSYTPPGNPTRLPSPVKSPSKPRLVTTTALTAPPAEAKPAQTPLSRRLGAEMDDNSVRTPSKHIQSSLDAAIDRKIREDAERRAAGWF